MEDKVETIKENKISKNNINENISKNNENKKLTKKQKLEKFKQTGEFTMLWHVRGNKSSELSIPKNISDLLFEKGWEAGIKYSLVISPKRVTLYKQKAQSNNFAIFRSYIKKRGKYENKETTLYLPINITNNILDSGVKSKSEFIGANEEDKLRIWF